MPPDPAEYGISERARRTPDKPALICEGVMRTFAELDARATRLAHALRARGIEAGDRVAIMLPNGIEFFETWTAAAKLGVPVVLVNFHLKHDELAYILADSRAKLLVTHAELADRHGAAEAIGCALLVVGADNSESSYEAAIAAVPDDTPHLEVTALSTPVFYTSGTTGRPKGVIHAGRTPGSATADDRAQAARNMMGQVLLWWWGPDDVYIVSGPAYHAGPGGWAMAALFVGATTVILRRFDAREWLAAVDQYRVTKTFMVPAHFIRLLELPEAERATYDT